MRFAPCCHHAVEKRIEWRGLSARSGDNRKNWLDTLGEPRMRRGTDDWAVYQRPPNLYGARGQEQHPIVVWSPAVTTTVAKPWHET